MKGLLTDAQAVYRREGLKALGTKTARTLLEPVVGEETAQTIYHNINRAFEYQSFAAPTYQFSHNTISIADEEYNIFFGFYDHTPFCQNNNRVLFNRTTAPIEPVSPSDELELCYYDLTTQEVRKFGETYTWNWQKGCRLQWYSEDEVIYNKLVDGEYGAVVQDVTTGEIRKEISHPAYDIGPDGKQAVSINFSRLERLHPDYGYRNLPDETRGLSAPSDDGIFLVDLENGESNLLVSFEELAERTETPSGVESYVMNLMINPDGTRVSVLHRYHLDGSRKTHLLSVELNDGDVTVLEPTNEASHPTWRSDHKLLSTINYWGKQRKTEFVLYDVETGNTRTVTHSELSEDTHPSFSPVNSNVFVGDSYPDHCGDRHLFLYSMDGYHESLGSVYGPVHNGTKRDLHPRWDREGKYVCIDVPRPSNRQSMAIINVRDVLGSMGANERER